MANVRAAGRTSDALLSVVLTTLGACGEVVLTPRQVPIAEVDQAPIIGMAAAVDGDAIEIEGQTLWLVGIDAPPPGSMCGEIDMHQRAVEGLTAAIDGQPVECHPDSQFDPEGRQGAHCVVGSLDLGERVVELGLAREWPEYSHGDYRMAELPPRRFSRGVWAESCPANLWPVDRDYSSSRAYRALHDNN